MKMIHYSLEEPSKGTLDNVTDNGNSVIFKYPCSSDKCTSYKVILHPGAYKFECWSGYGSSWTKTGNRSYVAGNIVLETHSVFYLYVGQTKGRFNSLPPEANVRSINYGGGASDIRLLGGLYSSFSSLRTRIMVAGGGGGSEWLGSIAAHAGALEGGIGYSAQQYKSTLTNYSMFCTGGTQVQGGQCQGQYFAHGSCSGSFGLGGYTIEDKDNGGMGGGGYYGGGSMFYAGAGGGGSSFISGHPNCNAITASSTEDNITHRNNPIHYSGIFFNNTIMTIDQDKIPKYLNPDVHGYIRISCLRRELLCSPHFARIHTLLSYTLMVLLQK